MLKWLLVLLVIVVVGGLLLGRGRADKVADAAPGRRKGGRGGPATMLRCAHCGAYLPQDEAVQDDEARVFCSEAHRLAGPR